MRTPNTSVVTVTPDIATKWLERNTHNRPVSDGVVQSYAEMMARKLWELNGEAIVFDWNETLLDGQHRLWACIEAKSPFTTVVVEGVNPNTFSTIDTGKKRSVADVLSISGVERHASTIGSAATIIINYERGSLLRRKPIPRQDVLSFVRRNPDLSGWVELAIKPSGWTRSYASNIASIAFLGARKFPNKAKEFVERFTSGEDLHRGSPVLALRNRLGTEKNMPAAHRLALIAQAWNAFAASKTLSRMQLPKMDEFPTVAGAKVK